MPKWHFQSSSFIPIGEIVHIQCLCPAWSDCLAQSSHPRPPSPSALTSCCKTAPLSRITQHKHQPASGRQLCTLHFEKQQGGCSTFSPSSWGFFCRLFVSRNAAVFFFWSHKPPAGYLLSASVIITCGTVPRWRYEMLGGRGGLFEWVVAGDCLSAARREDFCHCAARFRRI